MKERCLDVKCKAYKNYGGRGLTMYKDWENNFGSFFYWAIKNGHRCGLELDRIDNNIGYYPNNCRFVTHKENNRNKRNNRYIEHNGVKKTVSYWAELYGFNYKTLSNRLNRGWPIDRLFVQVDNNKKKS